MKAETTSLKESSSCPEWCWEVRGRGWASSGGQLPGVLSMFRAQNGFITDWGGWSLFQTALFLFWSLREHIFLRNPSARLLTPPCLITLCYDDPLSLRRRECHQGATVLGLMAQLGHQVITAKIKENTEVPPFLNILKGLREKGSLTEAPGCGGKRK